MNQDPEPMHWKEHQETEAVFWRPKDQTETLQRSTPYRKSWGLLSPFASSDYFGIPGNHWGGPVFHHEYFKLGKKGFMEKINRVMSNTKHLKKQWKKPIFIYSIIRFIVRRVQKINISFYDHYSLGIKNEANIKRFFDQVLKGSKITGRGKKEVYTFSSVPERGKYCW